MPTLFTKIIKGEIPSYKIAEDDKYFAFLDIYPLTKGHTLVIPKIENDYIFDLNDDLLSGLMLFSKRVAKAIDKSVDCKRVGIAVIGLEVPHTHIHLVPINNISDLSFTNKKLTLAKQELTEIAEKIRNAFV
ncbi:MAG: HIT family protein [Bacteroidia bacterium]|nr:HIT family protein [Bacteroidia bacterium]